MGPSAGRWAEGGLVSPSGLLPGNLVILVRVEGGVRNTEVAFTSAPNLLTAIADSPFTLTGQEKYSDD